MRRFLPTGLQMVASLWGGLGLMGAIAGFLTLIPYRNSKCGLLGPIGGIDLSARRKRYRRSEQYSFYPVLQLG